MNTLHTDVLIIGAGPVGTTLALCLAQRGVPCIVAERKPQDAPHDIKCNHVSARSMELYRQLGVADALRAGGLPDDYPHDVSYRTSTLGREITRIRIPGRTTRLADTSGPDGWWPTAEPPHRINQRYLEPILLGHARQQDTIRFVHAHELLEYTQNAQGVTATLCNLQDGSHVLVQARYLAGCDGGRSTVRKAMGARLAGDEVVQRVQSTCIRAPQLIDHMQVPPAWAMFSVNPRRSGNIYAIDGREIWLVHNYLRDHETDFESVDRDACIRAILGVDDRFDYEFISKEDWIGRRLVADRMRNGRVFIAGDAAHLWVPYAGYGMNAGLADAANLAWHLCAQIQGWAHADALQAYERERLPITEQVSHFAMNHAHAMSQRRRAIPPDIEDDTPQAQASREAFGRDLYELNVQQYCCAGLNFGYYYADSPLIAYDGEAHPPYSMGSFTASTVPGCRAPHFRLDDGRSLYDAFGPGYTLMCLRAGCEASVAALQAAAAAQRMPLAVLDLSTQQQVPAEYRHALLVARADAHTAWRGNALDAAAAQALVARLSGHG
ncbi:MAG: monooxygenase [Betaproteobacteria bacterium]|nr:monooxygenase [Betaproteobacteria bacterium]